MLYIEIHEQKLLIAHTNKNTVCAYKIAELSDQTINHGIIFDHKNILIHINEFNHTYKLKKPHTIINAPEICSNEGIFQTLAVFQFALILSKANIKIQKMISIPQTTIDNIPFIINNIQIPNLLHQIQAKTPTSPLFWLGTTISCFACAALIIATININQIDKLHKLQQSQNSLQSCVSQMLAKNNDLINLRKQNEALNTTTNKLHKYLSKNKNPLEFLYIVSGKMPNNVWLTKIDIGDASKTKSCTIEFVGYSNKIDSPLKFIEKLAEHTNNLEGLKLTYLKKLKTNFGNKKPCPTIVDKQYEFKICGTLTDI